MIVFTKRGPGPTTGRGAGPGGLSGCSCGDPGCSCGCQTGGCAAGGGLAGCGCGRGLNGLGIDVNIPDMPTFGDVAWKLLPLVAVVGLVWWVLLRRD